MNQTKFIFVLILLIILFIFNKQIKYKYSKTTLEENKENKIKKTMEDISLIDGIGRIIYDFIIIA